MAKEMNLPIVSLGQLKWNAALVVAKETAQTAVRFQ